MGPYDHYAVVGVPRNSKLGTQEVPTLNKWILEKQEIQCISLVKSSSFDPTSQTEDIGNSSMKASSYGLKT
jgi:hypothetical protein